MAGGAAVLLIRLAAAAAALLPFAAPAPAGAVTVLVTGGTLHVVGGPGPNRVTLGEAPDGTIAVSDTVGVTLGRGCIRHAATGAAPAARCGGVTTTRVIVTLGAGDDRLSDSQAAAFTHVRSVRVDGGDGRDVIALGTAAENDTIYGGPGDDRIQGGSGAEVLHGGAGDDVVAAGPGDATVFGDAGRDALSGGSGNATIDAVDGEADTVRCGAGDDTADVDQYDVVDQSAPPCTRVSAVTVAPNGAATAAPAVTPFAPHCRRTPHGRVCAAAGPLRGATYRGMTAQGAPVTVRVDATGRWVAARLGAYRDTCPDASVVELDGGSLFGFADRVRIDTLGTFGSSVPYEPDHASGFDAERLRFQGAFDGRRAAGVLVDNLRMATGGFCTSGAVAWTAAVG